MCRYRSRHLTPGPASTDPWELGARQPIRLSPGRVNLALSIKEFVVAVRSRATWTAEVSGYEYALLDSRSLSELFVYHWHPTGVSHIDTPHLHPGAPLLAALGQMRSIHLPTGHVGLPEFIGMLVREFEVRPARPDWARVLSRLEGP